MADIRAALNAHPVLKWVLIAAAVVLGLVLLVHFWSRVSSGTGSASGSGSTPGGSSSLNPLNIIFYGGGRGRGGGSSGASGGDSGGSNQPAVPPAGPFPQAGAGVSVPVAGPYPTGPVSPGAPMGPV